MLVCLIGVGPVSEKGRLCHAIWKLHVTALETAACSPLGEARILGLASAQAGPQAVEVPALKVLPARLPVHSDCIATRLWILETQPTKFDQNNPLPVSLKQAKSRLKRASFAAPSRYSCGMMVMSWRLPHRLHRAASTSSIRPSQARPRLKQTTLSSAPEPWGKPFGAQAKPIAQSNLESCFQVPGLVYEPLRCTRPRQSTAYHDAEQRDRTAL